MATVRAGGVRGGAPLDREREEGFGGHGGKWGLFFFHGMESRARGLGFQGWGISRGEVGQPGWAVRFRGMGRGQWGAGGGVIFFFL